MLRHVPHIAFALDEKLYSLTCRTFGDALTLWGASDGIRLVAAGTVNLSAAGVPSISRISLMPVTRQWLPVECVEEQRLVEQFVRERRSFRKVLDHGLAHEAEIPSVAISDRGEPALLLFAAEWSLEHAQ